MTIQILIKINLQITSAVNRGWDWNVECSSIWKSSLSAYPSFVNLVPTDYASAFGYMECTKTNRRKRPTSPVPRSALSEWHHLTLARARPSPTRLGNSKTVTFLYSWDVFNSRGISQTTMIQDSKWCDPSPKKKKKKFKNILEQPKFAIHNTLPSLRMNLPPPQDILLTQLF